MNKDNIKVALISLQNDADKVPPIGLVNIATYLTERKKIKNVKIFDKNFHNLFEEIIKYKPNIIGISAMTITFKEATLLSQKIKEKINVPIVLGGVHISTLPESLKPSFDMGVIGEGEETFSDIIELFLKKSKFLPEDLNKIKSIVFMFDKKLVKTPLRELIELDTLPFPNFDFVSKEYFAKKEIPALSRTGIKLSILTSRGCPYKCVFCSTSQFWKTTRFHSPSYVARCIKQQIEKYNIDYISILDDLFTVSKERVIEMKKEFDKYGILDKIIGIECQPRANLIDDELCRLMEDIKVKVVSFGFESGSERMLKWLKSGSVTVKMNKRALLLCNKYHFNVYGSLIFASPGEKIKDMKETLKFIDFLVKHKARYVWSFVATPFPATLFWDIALKRGKVSEDMDWDLLTPHNIDNPLLLDEDVDKAEFKRIFLDGRKKLRKLKAKLVWDFLLHNPFSALSMLLKQPGYYLKRFVKQVYKE